MKLLALDTASGLCSVALWVDDQVAVREVATARDHARLVLPMVQSLLAEAGLALTGLNAIAFGRGPGSFTGLRVAAGLTQGLAFGADLPVLPVSDLRALAQQAVTALAPAAPGLPVLACLDARMQEVYWGLFAVPVAGAVVADAPEQVCGPAQLAGRLGDAALGSRQWFGAGLGLPVWQAAADTPPLDPVRLLTQAEPRAREIALLGAADLAAGLAQPPEAAVPVYLRDDVARPSMPS